MICLFLNFNLFIHFRCKANEFQQVLKLEVIEKDTKKEPRIEEKVAIKITENMNAKFVINETQLDTFVYRSLHSIQNLDLDAKNITRSKSF